MKLTFNSLEELYEFADSTRNLPKSVTKLGVVIDPRGLLLALSKIATTGGKVQAIKLYRNLTGQGLKDSKLAIETVAPWVTESRASIPPHYFNDDVPFSSQFPNPADSYYGEDEDGIPF
jgi:hypothetical protein